MTDKYLSIKSYCDTLLWGVKKALLSLGGVPIAYPHISAWATGLTRADNSSTLRDFIGGHQLLAEVIGQPKI